MVVCLFVGFQLLYCSTFILDFQCVQAVVSFLEMFKVYFLLLLLISFDMIKDEVTNKKG